MTDSLRPGRLTYGCGLVLALLILIGSSYFVFDELRGLQDSIAIQKVLIRFDPDIGFLAGGVLVGIALALLCIPPLLGITLSSRAHTAICSLLVVAVVLGIVSRQTIHYWVTSHLEESGYVFCAERSKVEPRIRIQGWVLDASLCGSDLDIDEMTLPELREILSQSRPQEPGSSWSGTHGSRAAALSCRESSLRPTASPLTCP